MWGDMRRKQWIATRARWTVDELDVTCLYLSAGLFPSPPPKGVKSHAASHTSFLWFVFSIVFLLSPCGCRVATPEGIVCQHTIKARPATEDSISLG